jgi:hypothetical protein
LETRLAKFISVIFHPLLMPTYGFAMLFFTSNYISTFTSITIKLLILGITFLFTFLLPVVNAFILLKMGRIKSLEMESTEERTIPYGTSALYYFALFYLFYNANFPNIFKIVVLGAAVSVLMTAIINYKTKISAHMVGIGGVAGVAMGSIFRSGLPMQEAFIAIVFLSGIVGYARLKLEAHTPTQVYTGFLLGFLIELALMLFY